MPKKPLRVCAYPGCKELIVGTYCDIHKPKWKDNNRLTARERGYDSRWRKARLTFLRSNPLCVECEKEGWHIPATVVDHIIPHKGDMKLFWDRNNWQPLCKRHHDIKTARDDGGFGNRGRGR